MLVDCLPKESELEFESFFFQSFNCNSNSNKRLIPQSNFVSIPTKIILIQVKVTTTQPSGLVLQTRKHAKIGSYLGSVT
jgi:hypothetical protein